MDQILLLRYKRELGNKKIKGNIDGKRVKIWRGIR